MLPRIVMILPGDHFKQECDIRYRASHGTRMIERRIDTDAPGVWDQAMRGLQPDYSAPRSWDANGTTLVAADGQIEIIVVKGGARTTRRATGEIVRIVRIARRSERAGVATAGECE